MGRVKVIIGGGPPCRKEEDLKHLETIDMTPEPRQNFLKKKKLKGWQQVSALYVGKLVTLVVIAL